MTDNSTEPKKLEYLRISTSVLSTELVGILDEDGAFSYCYKFTTGQGTFYAARWYCLQADACKPSEAWLEKNDISKWTPEHRDYQKAWSAMIREELLRCRKNLLKDTLAYFREEAKEDAKEGLKNLLLEEYDSESTISKMTAEFTKNKVCEKTWKSVKL